MTANYGYFVIGIDADKNYDYEDPSPGCTGCGDTTGGPFIIKKVKPREELRDSVTAARGAKPTNQKEVGCYGDISGGGFDSLQKAQDWLALDAKGEPTPLKKDAAGKVIGSPEFAWRYKTIFITFAKNT